MIKKILALVFILTLHLNSQAQTIFINELCASNYINFADSAGDHGDWIELYNGGGVAVDVGGMYLTDDLQILNKFQVSMSYPAITTIPAGGHLVFWFDNKSYKGITHLSASLNSGGEQVGLTANDGITIIDSVTFPKQLYDISYGRNTDGNAAWRFFSVPTPGLTNPGNGAIGISGKATYNFDAGFYPNAVQLELSYPDSAALIYYTLNGNEPSPGRGILYTAAISIDTNAVVRSRVYLNNLLPGEIATKSYFINRTHDLPVMSIVTDSLNLWDDSTGIYVFGPDDYQHTFPYKGANFWENWKVPAHIELFETNDVEVISQNLNLSISGNFSRAYAQKSFNLEAKDALGQSTIPYQIFPQLPISEFKSFKVRNGGQDWSSTTMRDALNQTLVEGCMDLDHQSSRPAIIYLNGIYWGILNMEEKIDEDYLAEHHPYVNPDSVDLLQINMQPVAGDSIAYSDMINFIAADTLSTSANYNYVKTQMDVFNYIDYELVRIYLAATDWPSNNIKYWRPHDGSRKWRWILWDTEKSTNVNPSSNTATDHNTLNWATDHNIFAGNYPAWSTFLLRNLLANTEFKGDFIRHFADHINFTFCPIRMDSIINAFESRLTFEMPAHINKWQFTNDTIVNWSQGYFHSMAQWNTEVDSIRLFFDGRAPYMRTYIMQQFGIGDTSQISINVIPPAGGTVYIDSFPVPDNTCELVYFNGFSSTLTAHANTGYVFSGWTSAGGDTLPMTWIPNGDTTVNAYFTPLTTAIQEQSNFISQVFPNPTDDEVNIVVKSRVICGITIELYDVTGRKIAEDAKAHCQVYNKQISLKALAPGIYCVRIICNNTIENHRLVIQK
ncbi:MAG: CotH kinase family protein [Bacteroidota bacterium]